MRGWHVGRQKKASMQLLDLLKDTRSQKRRVVRGSARAKRLIYSHCPRKMVGIGGVGNCGIVSRGGTVSVEAGCSHCPRKRVGNGGRLKTRGGTVSVLAGGSGCAVGLMLNVGLGERVVGLGLGVGLGVCREDRYRKKLSSQETKVYNYTLWLSGV